MAGQVLPKWFGERGHQGQPHHLQGALHRGAKRLLPILEQVCCGHNSVYDYVV